MGALTREPDRPYLESPMRLTSSFSVFRFDPGEQDLAKARWLAREGKVEAAEAEYRKVLGRSPDIYAGWQELFELLRRSGRLEDALDLTDAAARHWGSDAAMPHTLRGAALVDLGRIQEGLQALERAIGLDEGLALAWHELGYACDRAGRSGDALMALDRAFALEPHTDTLMLRGRILREGGRFDAAEVAFQAATQSTEHDLPRREAEREVLATRRASALGSRRPREFTPRERWFFGDGGILLVPEAPGGESAGLAAAVATSLAWLVALAGELGWRPAAVAGASDEDAPLARLLAARFGAQTLGASALDPADLPLIVTLVADDREDWTKQLERLARWRSGWSFALQRHPGEPGADVVGVGVPPESADLAPVLARIGSGTLAADAPLPPEVIALARQPLSAWQARHTAPASPVGGRLAKP